MNQVSPTSSTLPLLIKAGLKRSQLSGEETLEQIALPQTKQHSCLTLDPNALKRFHHVTSWPRFHSSKVHPCFLHIAAFNIHMQMMLDTDFPFALLGLVHISNMIEQYSPVHADDNLHLNCRFADVRPHRKGWEFDILTDVFRDEQLVWSSVSTNLSQVPIAKSRQNLTQTDLEGSLDSQQETLSTEQSWVLGTDLGRRYARASNDFNLIHLTALTAKMFGFKRHIAHGMWSKAQCLSTLMGPESEAFSCKVAFKKPIFLPANVLFKKTAENLSHQGAAIEFEISNSSSTLCHLKGQFEDR